MLNSKNLVKIKSTIESKMCAPGRIRTRDLKEATLLVENLVS